MEIFEENVNNLYLVNNLNFHIIIDAGSYGFWHEHHCTLKVFDPNRQQTPQEEFSFSREKLSHYKLTSSRRLYFQNKFKLNKFYVCSSGRSMMSSPLKCCVFALVFAGRLSFIFMAEFEI